MTGKYPFHIDSQHRPLRDKNGCLVPRISLVTVRAEMCCGRNSPQLFLLQPQKGDIMIVAIKAAKNKRLPKGSVDAAKQRYPLAKVAGFEANFGGEFLTLAVLYEGDNVMTSEVILSLPKLGIKNSPFSDSLRKMTEHEMDFMLY